MAQQGDTPPHAFPGTIHVMPYTHADIAWVHTRAWHIDRYVRVMDEVLARFDSDPDYHYYVDTWIEFIAPYLKRRPTALPAIRRRVKEGRLGVCAGQYGNVRSTMVGNETQVRNIQLGLRRWKEAVPEVEFRVHSNIDVTLGHTQMPQLLALAGLDAYFVLRPLAALDAQGVPRAFLWKGLSGDTILVYRDTGVGLFQEGERFGPAWDTDWPAARANILSGYLAQPIRDGISAIALSVGVDDSRPDRFAFNDVPADYSELIRAWNEREASVMRYGTPDTLVAQLIGEGDQLQTIDQVLDPTCVSYNIALHGRRGLWWLRELADRALVDAEMLEALGRMATPAAAGPPQPSGVEPMERLWEDLLAWTPHAVQWLFREDWQEGEHALQTVIRSARARASVSVDRMVGACLPMDSAGVALVNPLPCRWTGPTPLWIMNSDLTQGLAGLRDAHGREVAMQVIGMPVPGAEVSLLADVTVPGCGFTTLETVWDAMPSGVSYAAAATTWAARYGILEKRPVEGGDAVIASDCVRLTLSGGHIVLVEDLTTGTTRECGSDNPFLEPVSYPITRTGWSSDALSDEPEQLHVESVRWDENGPLRWRLTRTGHAGGFWIRQNIDLVRGECAVRSTLQFLDAADEKDALLGISIPISNESSLSADIPFGVEPRALEDIQYGISERSIPGLIWGRTWVEARDGRGSVALLAADGDKLFRAHGTPFRLVHFMAQKTRVFEEGWEAYIDTCDLGGRQVFQHLMVLGRADEDQTGLVQLAERVRHPLTMAYVSGGALGRELPLLSVEPRTASLSSLVWQDDALVARLVQMKPEPAELVLVLPFEVASVTAVDLRDRPIPADVTLDGRSVHAPIAAWQILTLRIVPVSTGASAGRQPVGDKE